MTENSVQVKGKRKNLIRLCSEKAENEVLDVAEKHGKEILNEIPEIIKNGNIDNRHKRLVRVYVLSQNKKVVIG